MKNNQNIRKEQTATLGSDRDGMRIGVMPTRGTGLIVGAPYFLQIKK
jgi:hypothetical protein